MACSERYELIRKCYAMYVWTNANIYIQFKTSKLRTKTKTPCACMRKQKPFLAMKCRKVKISQALSCVSQTASCGPVPGTYHPAKRIRIAGQV